MKQQGMGFLMMHRDTRELLAAASLFVETRTKQDDINILELRAVRMMMAVQAGRLTYTQASEFTRPEIRTLKNRVAMSTRRDDERDSGT